jgi:hypothetical protein
MSFFLCIETSTTVCSVALFNQANLLSIREINNGYTHAENVHVYIKEVLEDTIDLRKKRKQEIIDMLLNKKYDTIDKDEEFKYLVKMPMDSVSEENVEKLLQEHQIKEDELDRIKTTTIEEMWLSELSILENEYKAYQNERKQAQLGELTEKKSIKKVVKGVKKVIKKSTNIIVEEEKKEMDNEEELIIIKPKMKKMAK